MRSLLETLQAACELVRTICERKLVDLDVDVEPQQFHHGMPTGFSEP